MPIAYRRGRALSGPSVTGVIASPVQRAMRSATCGTGRWSVWMCWANFRAVQPLQQSSSRATAKFSRLSRRHQAPLAQLPQNSRLLGEQREVVHLVAVRPQPPDDLGEVARGHHSHRCDDRPIVLARDEVQHLAYTAPPGGTVLGCGCCGAVRAVVWRLRAADRGHPAASHSFGRSGPGATPARVAVAGATGRSGVGLLVKQARAPGAGT